MAEVISVTQKIDSISVTQKIDSTSCKTGKNSDIKQFLNK